MLEVRGRCTNPEKAVEFFEMLPSSIPDEIKEDEFCEDYEAALNTFRYAAQRLVAIRPKRHVVNRCKDYHTCSACGKIVEVQDEFCAGCGRPLKWDSVRCLTDYKESKENEID